MFACEKRVHILLIHSSLLSTFVIAGASSFVISKVSSWRSACRNICAGLKADQSMPHSRLPEAVSRLTVILQFFAKGQACSWEIQERNKDATVSIVSRSSFLFFWRGGSRQS